MIEERRYNLNGDRREIYSLFDSLKLNHTGRIESEGLIYIVGSNGNGIMTQKPFMIIYGNGMVSHISRKENEPMIIYTEKIKDREIGVKETETLLKTELKLEKIKKRREYGNSKT